MFISQKILSYVAKCVLFSMGWHFPERAMFNKLFKYNRSVVVFSHTSYADFCILILYLLAYPSDFKYLRTLVKPQPFEYMGWILRKLGAIPATKVDEKNGGSVSRIVEELKTEEKSVFLISPKGTIVKREWRSGYYHIAKELDVYLMVAGLDYEKKCTFVSDEIWHDEGEPAVKEFLMEQLKEIVPLFPEDEVVEIRKHDENKRGMVNWWRMSSVGLCFVGIVYMMF